MKADYISLTFACSGVLFGIYGLSSKLTKDNPSLLKPAEETAPAAVERGRYLVKTSGCNDCHTPGFMEKGFAIPEDQWLVGVPVGWRGPWGTSYPSNLRRHVAAYKDVDVWIKMVRARNGLPPMPWPSLHAMTDDDLRAVHAYISSLEMKGEFMPPPVTPDKEPTTPYLNLTPVMPAGTPAPKGE